MRRDDQRGQRRNVGPACRIALRHAGDGDADEHRDRRGRTDRELARRAEQRVEQAADQIAVDAVLRRQPGERGVGERHRNAVGSEGHAGDRVCAQPLRLIAGKPLRRRKGRAPDCGPVPEPAGRSPCWSSHRYVLAASFVQMASAGTRDGVSLWSDTGPRVRPARRDTSKRSMTFAGSLLLLALHVDPPTGPADVAADSSTSFLTSGSGWPCSSTHSRPRRGPIGSGTRDSAEVSPAWRLRQSIMVATTTNRATQINGYVNVPASALGAIAVLLTPPAAAYGLDEFAPCPS